MCTIVIATRVFSDAPLVVAGIGAFLLVVFFVRAVVDVRWLGAVKVIGLLGESGRNHGQHEQGEEGSGVVCHGNRIVIVA